MEFDSRRIVMPVANEHELYAEFKGDWEEVRDCVKGNREIKRKRERYLPKLSGQSLQDYERYRAKVKFFGATGRALDGLHGNVFRKGSEQTIEVSDTFLKSLEDVDLLGTSIDQFVSDMIYDALQTNWGGILVDYPQGQAAHSLAEAEAQGLKAYLKYYQAENVINWSYKTINGRTRLSLVVLYEPYSEQSADDKFAVKKYKKYRVCLLDPDTNQYRQEVYDEKISLERPVETIEIRLRGKPMYEIPFYPVPGREPEKAMLYDLAQLNIQHFQDTADYQNGKHYTSIPTPIAIGLVPEYDEKHKPVPMHIGGTQFQFFPNENNISGVDVKFLEFSGSGMSALSTGINHIETQMAILGAHIIAAEKKGVETAEALRIHRIGENGVLAAFVRNVSDQVTKALRKKGEWDGENIEKLNEWSINFNTDYDLSDKSIQTLSVLLKGRSDGEIPRISLYLGLKALGLIPEQWDLDTFLEEVEKDAAERLVNNDDGIDKELEEEQAQEEPEPEEE
jgi:hypothetical protein